MMRQSGLEPGSLALSLCSFNYLIQPFSRFHFTPTYFKWVKLTQFSTSNNLGTPFGGSARSHIQGIVFQKLYDKWYYNRLNAKADV